MPERGYTTGVVKFGLALGCGAMLMVVLDVFMLLSWRTGQDIEELNFYSNIVHTSLTLTILAVILLDEGLFYKPPVDGILAHWGVEALQVAIFLYLFVGGVWRAAHIVYPAQLLWHLAVFLTAVLQVVRGVRFVGDSYDDFFSQEGEGADSQETKKDL